MELFDVVTSFEGPKHFSTLVVQPHYRIRLRLGEIDDLFWAPPDSPAGRASRLQVLGLFYFPMNHEEVGTAFQECWEWVKSRVFGVRTDAEADGIIQQALRDRIVGPAHVSFRKSGEGGGLPPAAEDPEHPSQEHFAKLRVPGGYAFTHDESSPNSPSDEKFRFSLGTHEICNFEELVCSQHPVLGKIPIVAKVERRTGSTWQPATGMAVYFQWQPPYALPAFDEAQPASRQFHRPPLQQEIEKVVREQEEKGLDPGDPQGRNCPVELGGRRGSGAGGLFAMGSVPGFHEPHQGRTLARQYGFYLAEATNDPHTVRTWSNPEGEAGVIFLPSRMGGDLYRLRVYVGSPTMESDGTETGAIRTETGTLVTWRNVRLSRYLCKDSEATVDERILDQAKPYEVETSTDYLKRASVIDPMGQHVGLPRLDLPLLAKKFARAFCELETDGEIAGPEAIAKEEYCTAYAKAKEEFKQGLVLKGIDSGQYCWDFLFPGEDIVLRGDSVSHLTITTPAGYNEALRKSGLTLPAMGDPRNGLWLTPDEKELFEDLVFNWFLGGFIRHLAKNGFLPGFTIVQSAAGCGWDLLRLVTNYSGLASQYRSAFLWTGKGFYDNIRPGGASFDFTSTVLHELGHCMMRTHGAGSDLNPEDRSPFPPAPQAQWQRHDPLPEGPEKPGTVCVMSYKQNPGEFCARCLLALRGWTISKIHLQPPPVRKFEIPSGWKKP